MAYSIAQDFARDADKVRVNVDGEVVRVCGALWKMTSELERKNSYTWCSPRFEKLGVLGQPNGPSLDQVRVAKAERFGFKLEEAKRKAERAALSAVTPTPALGRATGSILSLPASSAPSHGRPLAAMRASIKSRLRQSTEPTTI